MYVISESEARTTRTPAAAMTGLAAPSQGSAELSTWRVRMAAGAEGPVHEIDREQVWTLLSGSLTVTVGGRTETVGEGKTVIVPAGAERRFRTKGEPAEALVAMAAGGTASTPGSAERRRLPWAE
ncbi:cupin domain-containing protein [Streptomyces sp. 8N616]|uniref:cupin domain-containing protein n=1 Tax=Streptomyces sp. 8N616 TaxID=3457414 RepID=UPI003FD52812